MGDVNKELDITIRGKDEASGVFNSAFENIRSKAKQLNAEARSSGDIALERLLRGGGFLGIFTLAGEALKKMTSEAVKLSEELEKGKINAADVVLEIGKSIPMLGGFVEAGENINELFTHQKSDIEHINEGIKAGNELMELRVKQQKEAIKAEAEMAEGIRKANDALRLAQAETPQQKQNVEHENRLGDINAQLEKEKKDNAAKRQEELDKEIGEIRKRNEAEKQVAEDKAHDELSFYDKHSYNTGAEEAAADAKRRADFEVEGNSMKMIADAKKKASDDIAKHNAELEQKAAIERKTVAANEANENVKQVEELRKASAEKMVKGLDSLFGKIDLRPKTDQLLKDDSDAIAKAKEEQLRISGHALEADLQQLKREHEKRLQEIHRQAQEEVAARPEEAKKIRREEDAAVSAEGDSYKNGVAAARATAAAEQQRKHAEVQQVLESGHIQMLEKEAALGDAAAGREAQRLKIAEEYARKKEEILRLAREASDADKAALKQEYSQLDAQERVAQALAAMADLKPQIEALSQPTKYAGFEDFNKTHGILDAQRERDRGRDQGQIQKLQELIQHAIAISQKLDPLVSAANAGDAPWDSALA